MKTEKTKNYQYPTLPITGLDEYLYVPKFIADHSDSAPTKPVVESAIPTLAPLPGEYTDYRFRSFAQTVDGETIHTIIIRTTRSVAIRRMVVIVMGEQYDFAVPLDYSSVGNVYKNTVNGFNLEEGKNMIKVRFVDNRRHAIKVRLFAEIHP